MVGTSWRYHDDMSVRDAIEAALATEPRPGADLAAVELARQYATLLDEPAPTAPLAKAISIVGMYIPDDDDAAIEAWRKISIALAAHSVASDLGPKLLASLESLLLTPRARAAAKLELSAAAAPSRLDELANRRKSKGSA